jgi:hypothetical protein
MIILRIRLHQYRHSHYSLSCHTSGTGPRVSLRYFLRNVHRKRDKDLIGLRLLLVFWKVAHIVYTVTWSVIMSCNCNVDKITEECCSAGGCIHEGYAQGRRKWVRARVKFFFSGPAARVYQLKIFTLRQKDCCTVGLDLKEFILMWSERVNLCNQQIVLPSIKTKINAL